MQTTLGRAVSGNPLISHSGRGRYFSRGGHDHIQWQWLSMPGLGLLVSLPGPPNPLVQPIFPTDFQVPKKCKKSCTVHGPKNGCLRSNARCRKFPGIDVRFVFATHRDCRAHYRNRFDEPNSQRSIHDGLAAPGKKNRRPNELSYIWNDCQLVWLRGICGNWLCSVVLRAANCDGRPLARD